MSQRPATRSYLLALAAMTGCAVDPNDPSASAEETGRSSQEVNGFQVPSRPGVVQISIPGDPRVRTGLLVAPDLVMTSARFLSAATDASQIRITNGTTGAEVRAGLTVTLNVNVPVAMIQTTRRFTAFNAPVPDLRSPQSIVAARRTLDCFAYRTATELDGPTQAPVSANGSNEYFIGPPVATSAERLDDWDAGAPCFDRGTGAWSGIALSSSANLQTRVMSPLGINFYVENMKQLALARSASGAQPFMLQTLAPNGTRMCLDIPWGSPYAPIALNQFPCNGAPNQRWFLYFKGSGGPSFINASTGTCVDVPNASTLPGARLQTGVCNGNANQRWEANTGDHLSPQSAPLNLATGRRTLCMSVRGGASASSQPVEQAPCAPGAAHQDWELGYQL